MPPMQAGSRGEVGGWVGRQAEGEGCDAQHVPNESDAPRLASQLVAQYVLLYYGTVFAEYNVQQLFRYRLRQIRYIQIRFHSLVAGWTRI